MELQRTPRDTRIFYCESFQMTPTKAKYILETLSDFEKHSRSQRDSQRLQEFPMKFYRALITTRDSEGLPGTYRDSHQTLGYKKKAYHKSTGIL